MWYHAQEKKVRVKSTELTDSNAKNGTQTVKVTAAVDGQECVFLPLVQLL